MKALALVLLLGLATALVAMPAAAHTYVGTSQACAGIVTVNTTFNQLPHADVRVGAFGALACLEVGYP